MSDDDGTAEGGTRARVASVHAVRVDLHAESGPVQASLRSRALSDAGLVGGVAVGDWVVVAPAREGAASGELVVERLLPRRTVLLRQAAGERSEPQVIAANVDRVFVVTAVEGDFNVRRLERYLVAIAAGGAEAQIILTKADLVDDTGPLLAEAAALAPAFATSARNGVGIDELIARIPRGTTAALVGSSGVGKSALLNCLLGREAQREGAVRAYDGKGRHTTTRRELFELPNGGFVIDTPGMRELKPWLDEGARRDGVDEAFDDVAAIASACRYRDCLHAAEPDCAVRGALERCELSAERVEAWQKLVREQQEAAPRRAAALAEAAKRHDRSMAVALRKRVKDKGG